MSKWVGDNFRLFSSVLIMIVTAVAFAFMNFQTKGEAEIQNQRLEDIRQDLKYMDQKLDTILLRTK